jgi:hypothetical protein
MGFLDRSNKAIIFNDPRRQAANEHCVGDVFLEQGPEKIRQGLRYSSTTQATTESSIASRCREM